MMASIIGVDLGIVKCGKKTAKNYKLCFYIPAIAPKDEINMSANRHYFGELSLKRHIVHSNLFQQKSMAHHNPIVWGKAWPVPE